MSRQALVAVADKKGDDGLTSKTWNGESGDWNIAGDWTPTGVPGSLDTVLFGGATGDIIGIGSAANGVLVPELESVAAITLDNAATTLQINNGGELDVSGNLALIAGTIDLVGVLAGGTIAENGGTIFGDRGTLNGVSLIGPAQLAGSPGQALYIQGGISLVGSGGIGPGTFSLTGLADQLGFLGTQTLANAQIDLAGAGNRISVNDLTLAATATIVASSSGSSIYGASGYGVGGGSLTNDGTIILTGASASLAIATANFTNNGLITVGAGDVLSLGQAIGPIAGTGSLALAPGSTIVLGGSLTSAALMAEIASLVGAQPDVTIELGGTIVNTGATLDFSRGPLAGAVLDFGGDIVGGTILAGGAGPVIAGGTLDGVVYQGTLAIVGSLVDLTVADGITVQSAPGIAGTIAMTGDGENISLINTPTLDDVTLSVSGEADGIFDGSDSIFTLGPNFVATIAPGGFGYVGAMATLVSNGTIDATGSAATFQFDANTIFNGGVVEVGAQSTGVADDESHAQTQAAEAPNTDLFYGFRIGLAIGVLQPEVRKIVVMPGFTYYDEGPTPSGLILLESRDRQLDGAAPGAQAMSATAAAEISFGPTVGVLFGSSLDTSQLPDLFAQFTDLPAGVVFGGALDNTDATLDITSTGSLSTVVIAGTVIGGTILEDGGTLGFEATSILVGTTLIGSLDVSVAPDTGVVLTNTTVAGIGGAPALIAINGTQDSVVTFGQTIAQTLTDVQVDLGLGVGATGDSFSQVGGTLVLGAGVTIAAAGTSSIFLNASNGYNSTVGDATMTNSGVITDTGLLTIETFSGVAASGTPEQASFINTGLIAVTPGDAAAGLTFGGSVTNAGTISATGAETIQVLGTAFGNIGTILLGGGAGISFASADVTAGVLDLLDGAELVTVRGAGLFAATLRDFSAGDTVDFTTLPPAGAIAPYFTLTAGTLDIFQGASQVAALALPSHASTQSDFALVSDRHGGTMLTTDLPCFVTGTRLRRIGGEIAVERLEIGQELLSASGVSRRVAWIGRRNVACARHPDPRSVWPVRIAAGAFGAASPARDLFLSPDHAVFQDGVLIPIKHLINGRTIAQVAVDAVEYWHVELDGHDVLLAENLPCESYLDTGNRAAFANGAAHIDLHPGFAARSWTDACAELVQDGPRLIAAKQRLFDRAGGSHARPIPGLRVLAERRELVPATLAPDRLAYRVPPGSSTVRLMSPTWVPAFCDAASLDRRALGVRLFGVMVDGAAIELTETAFADGFHPIEQTAEGPCRWTTGDARLELPGGASVLVVRLGDGAARLDTAA